MQLDNAVDHLRVTAHREMTKVLRSSLLNMDWWIKARGVTEVQKVYISPSSNEAMKK